MNAKNAGEDENALQQLLLFSVLFLMMKNSPLIRASVRKAGAIRRALGYSYEGAGGVVIAASALFESGTIKGDRSGLREG